MAEDKGKKKKLYMKVLFWGIFSITAYVMVFTNQNIVTDFFTRGGMYAVLPVLTAFFFSFVHGSFANYVLSALGIEAAKKKK